MFACLASALASASPGDAAPKPRARVPFVGVRSFNFAGGTGTEWMVSIRANGHTKLWSAGRCRVELVYDGPFKQRLPSGDGEVVRVTRTRAFLLRGSAPVRGCVDDPRRPCDSDLEPVTEEPAAGPTGLC